MRTAYYIQAAICGLLGLAAALTGGCWWVAAFVMAVMTVGSVFAAEQ